MNLQEKQMKYQFAFKDENFVFMRLSAKRFTNYFANRAYEFLLSNGAIDNLKCELKFTRNSGINCSNYQLFHVCWKVNEFNYFSYGFLITGHTEYITNEKGVFQINHDDQMTVTDACDVLLFLQLINRKLESIVNNNLKINYVVKSPMKVKYNVWSNL